VSGASYPSQKENSSRIRKKFIPDQDPGGKKVGTGSRICNTGYSLSKRKILSGDVANLPVCGPILSIISSKPKQCLGWIKCYVKMAGKEGRTVKELRARPYQVPVSYPWLCNTTGIPILLFRMNFIALDTVLFPTIYQLSSGLKGLLVCTLSEAISVFRMHIRIQAPVECRSGSETSSF
jgi:hypothetical protein